VIKDSNTFELGELNLPVDEVMTYVLTNTMSVLNIFGKVSQTMRSVRH